MRNKYKLHILLFLITFFTTIVAGTAWLNSDPFDLENLHKGLTYALLILTVLTCHEFGHYFAARYHKVNATLPYYIPFPPLPGIINFGTLGAIIRIKSTIPNRKILFDIGIAGPIAGFIVSLAILIYGMINLPGIEYLYTIHPEYKELTELPVGNLTFGNTLLLIILKNIFVPPDAFYPPMNEIYHYPYLAVGWFGLFVTALNLLPVGQLDGGHISYAMFGENHKPIAKTTFLVILTIGILGFLPVIGVTTPIGWVGWLLWSGIIYFAIKLYHPPTPDPAPLDQTRMKLGWSAYIMLIFCFSPAPITFQM